MSQNNLTRDIIKEKFNQLTNLLIFKDSKEKALHRIETVIANQNLKNIDDFKYELAREWNDSSGEVFEGVMFATADWNTDVNEFSWEINKIIGHLTTNIKFPTEEDVRSRGNSYSSDLTFLFRSCLKKEGITLGMLGTEMDYAIYYFTKNEDYENAKLIFKEIGAEPLRFSEE